MNVISKEVLGSNVYIIIFSCFNETGACSYLNQTHFTREKSHLINLIGRFIVKHVEFSINYIR